VPALLIWASNDLISPVAVGERLCSLLPDARLDVLKSDDHWVAIEQADRVAELIREFFTS
jgi:pimeloyl-ACP methyl ester carboxylesterase